MRLQGQNFRILTYDTTAEKYKVIGMATSCTVTLTNNTEEASTKDDTGMSSKPEVVSQGWSVQVDSLNVADVGAMLTAMKNGTKFELVWDKTTTTSNQAPATASYQRKGFAYLSDATFTFNDRENSVKSLQFQGTGQLFGTTDISDDFTVISAGSLTKGQFVRLFLGSDNTTTPSAVIAAAKQLQLHVSLSLENSTTKDTTGNWVAQEPVSLSYDITTSALVESGETITSSVDGQGLAELENIKEAGTPVKWQIANVSGANNRTKGSVIVSGSAQLTQLEIQAQNKTVAQYNATLQGYGDYTVGA
jgi:hypothetical protein